MKLFFQWVTIIYFGLLSVSVWAQDDGSGAIIDRYESVTGLDKLTESDQSSAMMEVVVTQLQQGMSMPTKTIIKHPGKMRIEVEMGGQKILTIVDGDKGWISVPGQGVQPMPESMMAMIKNQNSSISQGFRWSPDDYTFTMGAEIEQGGKTLQGVRMVLKKPTPQISNMVVYFDKQTDLAVYCTMSISEGGLTMEARLDLSEYKTIGKLKIPSGSMMTVDGKGLIKTEIKSLQYNYPVTDDMFAKP